MLAALGVASIVIGLAAQSVLSDVFAGFVVLFGKNLRVGDRIKVGDVYGDIVRITLMNTIIQTPKNEMVIMPNSYIVRNYIVNYSGFNTVMISITANIGYEFPPSRVEKLLIKAASQTTGVFGKPDPFVLMKNFENFGILYELNVYTDQLERTDEVLSNLRKNVVRIMEMEGIELLTPSYARPAPLPKTKRKRRKH